MDYRLELQNDRSRGILALSSGNYTSSLMNNVLSIRVL